MTAPAPQEPSQGRDAPAAAPAPMRQRAAEWDASKLVLLLGCALTLLALVAMLWLGWKDYRNHVDAATTGQELLARVLEDHATREIDTASLALASLADRLSVQPLRSVADMEALLRDSQSGLPTVRGFVVIAPDGKVLASGNPAERSGLAVDLRRLGPLPSAGQERLGPYLAGRGMADLAIGPSTRVAAPASVGFIPLVRGFTLPGQGTALLVAQLNPDAFANHQVLALGDSAATASLTSYAGQVLAASDNATHAPGSVLADHEVFRSLLGQREHGSYEDDSVHAADHIVAFRASRKRPIVALVEYPHAAVVADWWTDIRDALLVLAVMVLLLAGMTVVAARGLRARERARAALDLAQAEVARRERELSITVKSVQELIFRTDHQGAITFVNARWLAVSGNQAQDAIGRHLADLVVPQQRATTLELFSPMSDSGIRTAQLALQTQAMAGERFFEVAVVPLVQQGRITGFAGSAVDVTDRVKAQRQLQTQLAITELMLEISPLPLYLRDLQGHYLSVNQAWEDFTGLRRADVVGRDRTPHLTPREREAQRAVDRELLAHGGRIRRDAQVIHADGSHRDVVLQKVLVPGERGEPAGVLSVMIDVSEFRAAERATREARDAAEEASRAKSEFIANISHELRTPLQSILGFSELGLMRAGDQQPRFSRMFQDIHSSGQRMLALVNDLLDVAKLESAVGTMHLERTDLRPLVRDVVREFAPQLADKSLRVHEALAPVPLVAKVDPLRFQQVLRNVLANAIRFSPAQGRIDIAGDLTAQGEIHLCIADRGPGIPPAELDRIFDAFVQSSATKDGSGGTGLGLAISRKILEILGGRIHAGNRPDGGAEFHIHVKARSLTETVPAPL